MPDPFYPSVDLEFIESHISASGKLTNDGIVRIGDTVTFVVEGTQATFKRISIVRQLTPGQVTLEQSTAFALKFSFLGALMQWLEDNRNWKEGAFIVPKDPDK